MNTNFLSYTRYRLYLKWEAQNHLLLFQVGFSVQIDSFNVTNPTRVRGIKQQHISRNYFITGQSDKVTNAHIFPALPGVGLLLTVEEYRQIQKDSRIRVKYKSDSVRTLDS